MQPGSHVATPSGQWKTGTVSPASKSRCSAALGPYVMNTKRSLDPLALRRKGSSQALSHISLALATTPTDTMEGRPSTCSRKDLAALYFL